MFKKVKTKFILISMIAISFVILLIVGTTNIVNYVQVVTDSDDIISYIMRTQENYPDGQTVPPENNTEPSMFPADFKNHFGQSVYNIRYFTVSIKNNEYFYNLNAISSVTEEEAGVYADEVFSKNDLKGYIDSYRYNKNANNDFAVFLLCDTKLNALQNFVFYSVLFSLIGLLVSFVFIFVFSGLILKPVKESYDKQKQFITNASHELKTPLTVISTNNELLELTQGENKYTQTISKQIGKMSSMTKSLTMLAKLGENPKVTMEEINVSETMDQMVDTFAPVFESNGKIFKADVAPDLKIESNMELLSQLVSILLENACKYTLHEAQFLVKSDKGILYIIQRNDVESIKDGDLSYFTERFYRDDNMRNKVAGSGIGLSIAQEITNALHGKMKIFGKDNWFNIQIEMKAN